LKKNAEIKDEHREKQKSLLRNKQMSKINNTYLKMDSVKIKGMKNHKYLSTIND